MTIVIDGEVYLTAAESAAYIGIKRETFYANVKPYLQQYKHGAFKRAHYKKSDLDQFKDIHPINNIHERS